MARTRSKSSKSRKRWTLTGPFVPPPEPKKYSKTLKFFFDKGSPDAWWAVRYNFEVGQFEWIASTEGDKWDSVDIDTLMAPVHDSPRRDPSRADVLRGLAQLFE